MRKLIVSLSFMALIAIGCSQKPAQRFSFSPEKPQVGEKVSIAYHPTGTPLEDADSLHIVIYEFTDSMTPNAREVEATNKGKKWSGSFVPDSSTLLVLAKFQSGKDVDINDPDGYKILFHDDAGNALPGVHAALAYVHFYGAGPVRLKRNEEKALEFIEKEFAIFPDQKEKFQNLYWNIILRTDKENGKKRVMAAADSLASEEELTLENKKLLANFYQRLDQTDKAESYKAEIRKAEPKGNLVQSERFEEFYQEKDLNKKIDLYNQFKADFPDNNNLAYMENRIVNEYSKLKRFDEAEEFLTTSIEKAGSKHYNTLAWAMVEQEINLKTAADIAQKGVDLARKDLVDPVSEKKPSYLTKNEWRQQQKSSLGMVLDTYAAALYKLGQPKEAIPAFEEAVQLTGKSNNKINERYASALIDAGENEKALQFAEELIKSGNTLPAFKEIYKKSFIAIKGSEEGLDAALVELDKLGLEKLKAELAKKLLDEPAPDFSLVDLQGKTIALKELKGKVLVLDFWATWCGPCKRSFPAMQKAVEKFKDDESVEFLFIDTWERGEDIEKKVADFIERNNYTFHVLMDLENKVVEAYGVEGIPTKFIVDGNGRIRFKSVGFSGDEGKMIEELSLMIEMVK